MEGRMGIRDTTYVGVSLVHELDVLALLGEGGRANDQLDVGQHGVVQIIHLLKDILEGGRAESPTWSAKVPSEWIPKHRFLKTYLHRAGVLAGVDLQH